MLDWKADGDLRLEVRGSAYGIVTIVLSSRGHFMAKELDDDETRSLTAAMIADGYGPEERTN